MKIKVLIGILVLLIAVNLATIGSYLFHRYDDKPRMGFDRPPRGEMRKPRFPRGMDREKRKLLQDLAREFRNSVRPIHETIREDERRIREQLLAEETDAAMTDSLIRVISEKRMKIQQKAIKDFIEAKKELTPDEQRVLASFLFRQGPEKRGLKKPRDRRRLK